MSKNIQRLPDIVEKKEGIAVLSELSEALKEAIKKHPEKALFIAGILGGLYVLKDKNFKFYLKKSDIEIKFEAE